MNEVAETLFGKYFLNMSDKGRLWEKKIGKKYMGSLVNKHWIEGLLKHDNSGMKP